ncbi:MAG: hypothetical protein NTV34_01935, partial [Proteobacteria bacterium]|nr:hypothetical protein [Pseudomonadota bacterium]
MNFLLTTLFLFATATNASTAGHGGGDNKTRPDHFMWFVGDDQGKDVTYCVTVGENPSKLSRLNAREKSARIQKSIETAITAWKDYRSVRPPQNARWLMNLTPRYVGNCRAQNADLTVLMGSIVEGPIPEELFGPERIYRKEYQNPAAYARLKSYDFKKGWGQGVIWLHDGDPFQYISADGKIAELDFQTDGVVEALIMHEMGHVFGNGHISGTIMDENFIDTIAAGLDSA